MIRGSLLAAVCTAIVLTGPAMAAVPDNHHTTQADCDLFSTSHCVYTSPFKVDNGDRHDCAPIFTPVKSHCTIDPKGPVCCDPGKSPAPTPETTTLVGLAAMLAMGVLLASAKRMTNIEL